jgi:hypothetical protein
MSPFLSLSCTSLIGRGTVAAPLSGNGTITASGGTLELVGAVSGPKLAIATTSASDLKIDGTATAAAVSITNANQTLEVGPTASLTLTGSQTISLGKIKLDGGTLTDTAGITLGGGSNSGTMTGFGTIAAAVPLGGSGTASSITATGGTLEVTGAVTGISTLAIGSGATDRLLLDAANSATSLTFAGSTGTLELNSNSTLTLVNPSAIGANTAKLDGVGTTQLTDTAGITLAGGTISGTGTVSGTTSITGYGTVSIPLTNADTITASGGTLDLTAAVSSGSAFQIANVLGSDLEFDSSVGASTTITFDGETGLLDLTKLANFQGTVAGFAPGDGIQVAGATSVALDSTGKMLTVFDGPTTLGTITLASSYAGDTFSVSNSTISVSLPSPPAPTVNNVISGPSNSDNATLNFSPVIPPDNALAVSANEVLMAENDVIEITNRTGTILQAKESLSTFFSAVDGGYSPLTDPRAIVDQISGNFIVSIDALMVDPFFGDVTGSAVLYAVSNTTDPTTGGWTFGQANTTYSIGNQTKWSDQPTIASDGTNLYITSAQFSMSPFGTSNDQYVANVATIIPLSTIPSGGTPVGWDLGNLADYRPATVPGWATLPGGEYFLGYTGSDSLQLRYYSNSSNSWTGNSISLGSVDVGNGTYTAGQEGSSVLLDAGDGAVANTVYANGYLYAVFEVVPPGTTQPAVHWVKIGVPSDSVVAQGNITGTAVGGSGAAVFNPSIAVDQNGDVLVNYTVGSPRCTRRLMPR